MASQTGGLFICRPEEPLHYSPGVSVPIDLYSDLHIGSPQTQYDLIEKELARSLQDKARVNINGDVFDAIIPSDAKRYTPSSIHARLHGCTDAVNKAVDWAVELLSPVAHLIDTIAVGNHEAQLERRHSLDMSLFLVNELNRLLASKGIAHRVWYAGYTGFIRYQLAAVGATKTRRSLTIFYHHGAGSGSSLASSASEFEKLNFVEGADVFWLGHKHSRLSASVERISCSQVGFEPRTREVRLVRTGAYMRSYGGQTQASVQRVGRKSSYAADAMYRPMGLGGARLLATVAGKNHDLSLEVLQ